MENKYFLRYGIPGIYGPRVFVTYHDAMWDILVMASIWRGYDKHEIINGVEYFGFEMPDLESCTIAVQLLNDYGFIHTDDHK